MEGAPFTVTEARRLLATLTPAKVGSLHRTKDAGEIKVALGLSDEHPLLARVRELDAYEQQLAERQPDYAAAAEAVEEAQKAVDKAMTIGDPTALVTARAELDIAKERLAPLKSELFKLESSVLRWREIVTGELTAVVRFVKEQATYIVEAAPGNEREQQQRDLYAKLGQNRPESTVYIPDFDDDEVRPV